MNSREDIEIYIPSQSDNYELPVWDSWIKKVVISKHIHPLIVSILTNITRNNIQNKPSEYWRFGEESGGYKKELEVNIIPGVKDYVSHYYHSEFSDLIVIREMDYLIIRLPLNHQNWVDYLSPLEDCKG